MAAPQKAQLHLPLNKSFDPDIPHYGMWVGEKFYTIESFIEEAARIGISKRISQIPVDLVLGESRIYFAHAQRADRIATDPILSQLEPTHYNRLRTVCKPLVDHEITPQTLGAHPDIRKNLFQCLRLIQRHHPKLDTNTLVQAGIDFVKNPNKAVVFGYTVVSRIEFIIPQDGKIPEKIRKLAEEGHVKLVPARKAAAEPQRGCGKRKPGGLYAVAYEIDADAMQALRGDAKDVDIRGTLAVYKKPFKCWFGDKVFRGTKRLERDVVRKTEMMARLIGEKEN